MVPIKQWIKAGEIAGKRVIVRYLPSVLTGVGIGGFITTTVIACRETPKAIKVLEDKEKQKGELNAIDKIIAVAPVYAPSIISGGISIACILTAHSLDMKKAAAAIAACQISEAKLEKYKDAVAKTLGDKKAQEVKDTMAKDTVRESASQRMWQCNCCGGSNDILCIDDWTHVKFRTSKNKIDYAFSQLENVLLPKNEFVPVNDLLELMGVPPEALPKSGEKSGWYGNGYYGTRDDDRDHVYFEDSYAPDPATGEPCMVIGYSIDPHHDFRGDSDTY